MGSWPDPLTSGSLDHHEDIRGVGVGYTPGSATFTARNPPHSKLPDNTASCSPQNPSSALPVGDPMRCTQAKPGQEYASARSSHSRGVVVGMVDGSVKFVGNDINLDVWRAMSTRRGAENVAIP